MSRASSNPLEDVVLGRARAEAGRMRRVFELREAAPVHVRRAWCQDCEAVVELTPRGACPCSSRSVVPHGARRVA